MGKNFTCALESVTSVSDITGTSEGTRQILTSSVVHIALRCLRRAFINIYQTYRSIDSDFSEKLQTLDILIMKKMKK